MVLVRDAIRVRHYSLGTEQTYLQSIRRYIFHNKRHPDVSTTMIYTHVLNKAVRGVHSPLDQVQMKRTVR